MENKNCKTILIDDKPASFDEFEGAHEKVAKAISDLIIFEEGGKSIALTGSWGSGKSTVVELIG
jgi:ABC-type transport system involved in cytochrome bd biosynthesis fused ATPase/permease subunit